MLKQVAASTLRNHLRDVLKEVDRKKDYILITRKSRPVGAMVNLDFFEDLLALSSPRYRAAIREAREDFKAGRTASHAEVFGEIG